MDHLEQFRRVKRYYERIKEIDRGTPHIRSTDDYYRDDFYAFFQNCYHLKDWIKNDYTLGEGVRNCVENYINQNEDLLLCADICNRKKHLELNRPRSNFDPRFRGRVTKMSLKEPSQEQTISIKFNIDTYDGQTLDAFELATKCVQAWENFINKNIGPPQTAAEKL